MAEALSPPSILQGSCLSLRKDSCVYTSFHKPLAVSKMVQSSRVTMLGDRAAVDGPRTIEISSARFLMPPPYRPLEAIPCVSSAVPRVLTRLRTLETESAMPSLTMCVLTQEATGDLGVVTMRRQHHPHAGSSPKGRRRGDLCAFRMVSFLGRRLLQMRVGVLARSDGLSTRRPIALLEIPPLTPVSVM